ncbi:dTDP-4-dehydrorhamnose reductase [Algibacter sp. PT7-4]|uniref:dTDP-4-dehydrorhamnose reductase n=1 Tax=Algibacter ulvanivorans TaxID=3400999 RepID=UPI003AAB6B66
MKKKVLVTGAHGQLGSTIKELFKENNINLDFVFVSKDNLDITRNENLDVFFKNNTFHYCINCAAYTNVEQAEKTPDIAYKINAEGVKNIALKCREYNVVLIHISTDYVFDGEKRTPYVVEDKTNPINEYGKSKLLGEKHIQNTLSNYYIVRTSWLYSKTYGKNFYKTIINKAKTEKELFITTEQMGCPTDTVNLSKFIIKLIQDKNLPYGIYHFCDEKAMTWYNFAEQILKENSKTKQIQLFKSNNYKSLTKRPKYSVLKNK